MKKRSLALVLFVLMSCLSSLSMAIGATEVSAMVPQTINLQPLKGSFLQVKNIKPLKRPFKSEGGFIYFPNKGLLWHTKKPVDSIKLFANDGVYKIDEQGAAQKESQLDNDFFLALFSADEQELEKFFIVEEVKSEENTHIYCLALTPINSTMSSLFSKINLCVTQIEPRIKIPTKIVLIEVKGNMTEIQLQLTSAQITAEELAYFD